MPAVLDNTRSIAANPASALPLTIRQVNPLTDPHWDAIVQALGGNSIFHTSAWAHVLSATYRYTPCYFAVFRGSTPVAAIPVMEIDSVVTGRRGVSLPFSDTCDLLGSDEDAIAQALQAAIQHGISRKWRYLELRSAQPSSQPLSQPLSSPSDRTLPRTLPQSLPNHLLRGQSSRQSFSKTYYRHILPLHSNYDTVYNHFNPAVRRAIRKAERAGLTIEFSRGLDAMRDFYRLHCRKRRLHGLPPQPFRFFDHLQQHVLQPGLGTIVLARHGQSAIAASVFAHYGHHTLYKYGASDPQYQDFRANNLVMARAIEHYASHGFASLDLGRTDLDAEGLRRFKLGWGAVESEIQYCRFDLRRQSKIQNAESKIPPSLGPLVLCSLGPRRPSAREGPTRPTELAISDQSKIQRSEIANLKSQIESQSKIQNPKSKISRHLPIWLLRLAGKLLYRHVG